MYVPRSISMTCLFVSTYSLNLTSLVMFCSVSAWRRKTNTVGNPTKIEG